jgi:hypothetical protein
MRVKVAKGLGLGVHDGISFLDVEFVDSEFILTQFVVKYFSFVSVIENKVTIVITLRAWQDVFAKN